MSFQKEYDATYKRSSSKMYCDDCRSEIEPWCRRPYHGIKTDGEDWCVTCYNIWYQFVLDYKEHTELELDEGNWGTWEIELQSDFLSRQFNFVTA